MSEIDELFGEQKNTEMKPYDKDEWIKQKQENRNAAFDMVKETAYSLKDDVSKLNTYLDVQSRFDRYSVSNALLITAQKPDATRLCDSKQWQKLGAFIKKGEKGITILEPSNEYTKKDNTVGVSFNAKKVFDVSQTTAKVKAYPERKNDFPKMVTALVKTSPVTVNINNDLPEDVKAIYSPENKSILIRQGMDGADIFRALSYEIAMARADNGNFNRDDNKTHAYCVSYIICKRNGVEPNKPDVDMKPFDEKDSKTIRAELSKIRDEANNIGTVIDKALEPKDKDAR